MKISRTTKFLIKILLYPFLALLFALLSYIAFLYYDLSLSEAEDDLSFVIKRKS